MIHELTDIGVTAGDCLIVHSSFKSLGLTSASSLDVIHTLLKAVGNEGTVIMPTFTYSCAGIRGVKPFNPATTPGRNTGILTETLRKYPGAFRSRHPTHSVTALGRYAEHITANMENASPIGLYSSFHRAYRLNGKILLLGVGNSRNSMLHLAEVMAGLPYNDIPFREFWGRTALVEKDGRTVSIPLKEEFPACSGNFGIADDFLKAKGIVSINKICSADSMLINSREMVDTVVDKLKHQPAWLLCDSFACEPCSLRTKRLREKGLI